MSGAARGDEDPRIDAASAVLRRGGLVAIPTETVYGLAAWARSEAALDRLYAVKGRPRRHPVIVHLASADALGAWAREIPDEAHALAAAFWPGPLTLLLRRRPDVPDAVTGGRPTVGLRVPAPELTRRVLTAFGDGVAAPSANRFGRVSPTTAAHVERDLGGDVDLILDDGPCPVGVESTIVDVTTPVPALLRPGAVTAAQLEGVLGRPVNVHASGPSRAPGMLPSHYAPRARVEVLDGARLGRRAQALLDEGERVAVLSARGLTGVPTAVTTLDAGDDGAAFARQLYARLREADDIGATVLLVAPPAGEGVEAAVRDRLRRAAADRPESG